MLRRAEPDRHHYHLGVTSQSPIQAAVWCRTDQHDLLRLITDTTGLVPVSMGHTDGGPIPEWASAVGQAVTRSTDVRHLAETTEADVLLIADPGPFADGSDSVDLRSILRAAQRGVAVLSFEPIPSLSLRLLDPAWREASEVAQQRVMTVPMLRRGAMARQLTDLLDGFGPVEAIGVRALCRPGEGSLGARLYETCDLLHALLGVPIGVDAAHSPGQDSAASTESLRGLSGHLSAVLRFEHGQTASVLASDRAGAWSRSVTLLGPGGRVDGDDRQLVWTDASGSVVESLNTGLIGDDLAAAVLADDINAALGRSPRIAPVDQHAVLSIAHAALLSLKTGHAENPREILRISSTA